MAKSAKKKPTAKKKAAPKKTAAKPGSGIEGPMGEHHSVSVRKISNGYVVSKSCDKNGKYTSTETFCKDKPTIGIQAEGKKGK